MELEEKISEIVTSLMDNEEHFLVDLNVKGLKGGKVKIAVFLDGDNGISIEDCAKYSRQLGQILEEDELVDKAYTLDVSSPGLDKPLKLKRQYQKNVGRKIQVETLDNKTKTGVLKEVQESSIQILPEKKKKDKDKETKMLELAFDQIKKTKVLVSFN